MSHRLFQLGSFAFATPARAAWLLAIYLALHAAVRLWLLPQGLGYDDAEQVLSAQRWALAYRFEQPPLATWLLKLVAGALGVPPGLGVLTVLRTLMLATLFLATYLAARAWLGDHLRSAVAAAALSGTYTLGWLAQGDLPHSTLLAVMVAVALWCWARLLERPTMSRTLAFAVVCGLGLLAKWNFVLLALGFLVVGLMRRDARPLVLSWRTPLILVVAGLIAAPAALAVISQHPAVGALASGVLAPSTAPAAALEGLGALALSALAFPQPWLALALLVLWPARQPPDAGAATLALLMAVVLALHAALVPLVGVVDFPERWMIVPLLPLSILVLASVAAQHRRVLVFGGVLVVLAMSTLALRVGIGLTDGAYCGKCRTRVPAAAFADGLRAAGFEDGMIVVDDMHLGGNLKRQLPEARVVALSFPEDAWPEPGDGECVVAWPAAARGEGLLRRAADMLGADLDTAPAQTIEAPLLGNAERSQSMTFKLAAGAGACR